MAVIIPTGISVGARRVLEKVSQITKKLAPNKVDAGIRILRSGPTYNRTIWGTINPTNPIGPQVATAVPVIKDAVKKPIFCVFPTFTPRLEAECTPVLMRFKSLLINNKIIIPIKTIGKTVKTVL